MTQPFTPPPAEPPCRPTLRDRFGNLFFKNIYRAKPPWDVGLPQPEIVALADAGDIRGDVLDIGCGTGENALFLAGRGLRVVGLDFAARAIAQAKEKSAKRNVAVEFLVGDAIKGGGLQRAFDTVIDCGLFHIFGPNRQPCYVTTLARLTRPGGRLFVLCFSEHEPGNWGPRRITQAEIRQAFRDGWVVNDIRSARLDAKINDGFAKSWLATITRT
jgi:SAM-dependent methyltransferase